MTLDKLVKYQVPDFLNYKSRYNCICLIWLLCGLNELIHIKKLEQCLAHGKNFTRFAVTIFP